MMSHSTRVIRRPRRARPPAVPTAAIIAAAALALLAVACSGSPSSAGHGGSPHAGGSANSPSGVAYSACIRSHGVPDYPDPGSNGQLPKGDAQQFGVSSSRYQAARTACQHLYPAGGSLAQREHQCAENSECSPALLQQWINAALKLARCMRSHGVPNFPDPTADSSGVTFNISRVGITDAESHSPQFMAELNACGRLAGNFPEQFG